MSESLYRYMSFESFVDTVQRKQLHFVHPSEFEDPMEFQYLQKMCVSEPSNYIEILYRFAMVYRFYVQSWTALPESDAMWRIYNYNNFAVRIEIDKEAVGYLEDVQAVDVVYTDEPDEYIKKHAQNRLITEYKSLAIKRNAFEHEKEVRLVKHIRWENEQEAYENTMLVGATVFDDVECKKHLMELYTNCTEEQIKNELSKRLEKFNINANEKSIKISFSHIKNFIKTVLVSPFAPEWYVETVETFCRANDIIFLGKSKLYDLKFLLDE